MSMRKLQLNTGRAVYSVVMITISLEIFNALVYWLLSFAASFWHPNVSLNNPIGVPIEFHHISAVLYTALPLMLSVITAGRFGNIHRPVRRDDLPLWQSTMVLLPLFLAVTTITSVLASFFTGQDNLVKMPSHGTGLWISVICVCVIPAVGEEILFRGTIQNMLQSCGPWTAIWGQALLFGAVHSFGAPMITASISGLVLGLFYTLTGDLRLNMVLHGINNAIGLAESYAYLYADGDLAMAVILVLNCLLFLWSAISILYMKRYRMKMQFYPVNLTTGRGKLLHSPVFLVAIICLVLTRMLEL